MRRNQVVELPTAYFLAVIITEQQYEAGLKEDLWGGFMLNLQNVPVHSQSYQVPVPIQSYTSICPCFYS